MRASRITNSVLVQISKLRDFKPTYAEKLLSQLDKSVHAIVRVKLKYFKDAFSLEMKCYLRCKKTDFHVLELFCRVMLDLQ